MLLRHKNSIKMGTMPDSWLDGKAKTITFSVTEDCNLACKYCYMTGKNRTNKMDFDTAKKTVDYVLSNPEMFESEGVVWEFVGGEPFIEIELIDKICDYIKLKMFELSHPWFNSYRFNFSTNGLLYGSEKVQKYIQKNKSHLSIGISIDGNKIKHDLQRVKLDGSGSYDDIIKIAPLWLEQFPNASTKATFSSDDLIHLKDSVISLWNNGIKMVTANVVFEDVWREGDDLIFETQLKELADYILENNLYIDHSVRFFDPSIGFPLDEETKRQNFCGSGKMMAVDYKGDFFPCVRFLDFSLNNRNGICLGNSEVGISADKMRPFYGLSLASQSTEECINCDVAQGCSWCTAFNYDQADTDTVFQRATFNCKMHKANVRACEYFWEEFKRRTSLPSPREEYKRDLYINHPLKDKFAPKYLQFITSDKIVPHCNYRSNSTSDIVMDQAIIENGIFFANENGFIPVFLGKAENYIDENISIISSKATNIPEDAIVVCDNSSDVPDNFSGNCILLVSKNNISNISFMTKNLFSKLDRINLVLNDIDSWNEYDLDNYKGQLNIVKDQILQSYSINQPIELNVLTDILNLSSNYDCDAGQFTFSLAPNGKFYICPAFYFNNPDDSIGDLESGIQIKNKQLLNKNNADICNECDAKHCTRCKYLNKKLTGEINTPSRIQCVVSHIERNMSRELQQELAAKNISNAVQNEDILPEINYIDPFEKILLKVKGVNCNG